MRGAALEGVGGCGEVDLNVMRMKMCRRRGQCAGVMERWLLIPARSCCERHFATHIGY